MEFVKEKNMPLKIRLTNFQVSSLFLYQITIPNFLGYDFINIKSGILIYKAKFR
jgi:hypothetical protein